MRVRGKYMRVIGGYIRVRGGNMGVRVICESKRGYMRGRGGY